MNASYLDALRKKMAVTNPASEDISSEPVLPYYDYSGETADEYAPEDVQIPDDQVYQMMLDAYKSKYSMQGRPRVKPPTAGETALKVVAPLSAIGEIVGTRGDVPYQRTFGYRQNTENLQSDAAKQAAYQKALSNWETGGSQMLAGLRAEQTMSEARAKRLEAEQQKAEISAAKRRVSEARTPNERQAALDELTMLQNPVEYAKIVEARNKPAKETGQLTEYQKWQMNKYEEMQKQPKKLSGEAAGKLSTMWTGIKDGEEYLSMLNKNDVKFWQNTVAGRFQNPNASKVIKGVVDALARLRTGAALTSSEEDFYNSLIADPVALSTKEGINATKHLMHKLIASQKGAGRAMTGDKDWMKNFNEYMIEDSPEDAEARQWLLDNPNDPDAPAVRAKLEGR